MLKESELKKREEEENKQRYRALKEVTKEFHEELGKPDFEKNKLKKIFEELYNLATKDQLTGVMNRRALDEALGHEMLRAIREGSPISVIMIDVDHFKKYNDTYGHQQGDEALRTVTSVVQKNTRAVDFVARYGGEEFIIVMPELGVTEAVKVAERIRKAVEKAEVKAVKKDLPPGYEHVTISLGVSGADRWEKDGFEITHRADVALYEAKRSGRNKVYVAK